MDTPQEIQHVNGKTNVTLFRPEKAKVRDKAFAIAIEEAARVHDWTQLTEAAAQKVAEQQQFVAWWDGTVGVNHGGARGKSKCAARGTCSFEDAEKLTGIMHQQVSRWRRCLNEADKYVESLVEAARAKAMKGGKDVTASKWTGDPESYTPAVYVESARQTMGGIDLDPASNSFAQETVKAALWYGAKENGLLQQWSGRVFLNPPYSFPEIAHFVEKLCTEVESGHVAAAILLTNNNTDAKWWHRAASASRAVCFTAGRINFYKADGTLSQPTNGQTFFYFGADLESFKRLFAVHGLVMTLA